MLAPRDDAPHRPRTVGVDHRAHGALTADAAEPAGNGYLLTVVCSCGVLFAREDAEFDLLRAASLNCASGIISPPPGRLAASHPPTEVPMRLVGLVIALGLSLRRSSRTTWRENRYD